MTGLSHTTLKPGVRFALKNRAFEVTHVDVTMTRYAPLDGGRAHQMPTQAFWELTDQGVIGFLATDGGIPLMAEDEYRLCLLTEPQREEMFHRYAFVKEAISVGRKPLSAKNLQRAINAVGAKSNGPFSPPGHSTLAKWIKRYVQSGGNVTSLVPQHDHKGTRHKKFPLEVECIIARSIKEDYLTLERPTIAAVHANVVGRLQEHDPKLRDEFIPSVRTIHRRIEELDPYISALKRHGQRYADAHVRAAGASFEASRLMQIVMIDGHRMDVLIVDPGTNEILGRAHLTCLFDVLTRTVVGWHISLLPFCSTTALAAIKDMVCRDPATGPGGVAESIIPDNGRDLISDALRNLCKHIGMHIQGAKTYTPDDKAHLERFFRTLNEQLIHLLKGTLRSSPTDRGDYDSEGLACVTMAQLKNLFAQWLNEIYHVAIHSATGRAPSLFWRDQQGLMPILSFPEADINVVARVCSTRVINKGRVTINGLSYKSAALATLEARGQRDVTVMVDELDLGFVYVQHKLNPKLIYRADAVRVEYTKELTKYEHDEVTKRLKEMTQRDLNELGPHAYEIARWRLWKEIHKLGNSKSSRQLALLTQGVGKKEVAEQKAASVGRYVVPEELADVSSIPDDEATGNNENQSTLETVPPSSTDVSFEIFDI